MKEFPSVEDKAEAELSAFTRNIEKFLDHLRYSNPNAYKAYSENFERLKFFSTKIFEFSKMYSNIDHEFSEPNMRAKLSEMGKFIINQEFLDGKTNLFNEIKEFYEEAVSEIDKMISLVLDEKEEHPFILNADALEAYLGRIFALTIKARTVYSNLNKKSHFFKKVPEVSVKELLELSSREEIRKLIDSEKLKDEVDEHIIRSKLLFDSYIRFIDGVMDDTDQENAEKFLRMIKEQLNLLYNVLTQPLMIYDPDYIQYLSAEAGGSEAGRNIYDMCGMAYTVRISIRLKRQMKIINSVDIK